MKRLSGIFVRINVAKKSEKEEPFSHNVYFLASMLDPQFGLSWVDLDVNNEGSTPSSQRKLRDELKKTLRGYNMLLSPNFFEFISLTLTLFTLCLFLFCVFQIS